MTCSHLGGKWKSPGLQLGYYLGFLWGFCSFLAPVWLILQDLQPGSHRLAKRLQHDGHIGTCVLTLQWQLHMSWSPAFEWIKWGICRGMARNGNFVNNRKSTVNLRLQPKNSEGPKCRDVISTGRMHWWGIPCISVPPDRACRTFRSTLFAHGCTDGSRYTTPSVLPKVTTEPERNLSESIGFR